MKKYTYNKTSYNKLEGDNQILSYVTELSSAQESPTKQGFLDHFSEIF